MYYRIAGSVSTASVAGEQNKIVTMTKIGCWTERSSCLVTALLLCLWLAFASGTVVVVYYFVFNGGAPIDGPWEGVCTGQFVSGRKCILAAGQFVSSGLYIFAVGQFANGMISISMFGVSLMGISMFGIAILAHGGIFGVTVGLSMDLFGVGVVAPGAFSFGLFKPAACSVFVIKKPTPPSQVETSSFFQQRQNVPTPPFQQNPSVAHTYAPYSHGGNQQGHPFPGNGVPAPVVHATLVEPHSAAVHAQVVGGSEKSCVRCGAGSPQLAVFCTQCGFKHADEKCCSSCGAERTPNARFCAICGNAQK